MVYLAGEEVLVLEEEMTIEDQMEEVWDAVKVMYLTW